jgi:hypothetical protein
MLHNNISKEHNDWWLVELWHTCIINRMLLDV